MGYTKPSYISLAIGKTANTPYIVTTTYYFGRPVSNGNTNATRCKVVSPCKGVIRAVVLEEYAAATAGSNEDWTMLLRLNNTTDYTISTVGVNTNNRLWENYSMNVPIGQGEYFEIKTTTPNWVTPVSEGSGYGMQGFVLIEVA